MKAVTLASAARALAGALLGIVISAPVMADMRVIESNVPEYAVGAVLPDSPSLKLPAGGRVRVLMLPSNTTRTFEESAVKRSSPITATRKAGPPKKEEKEE